MEIDNIYGEVDMLKGNINRMCVTDDVEELNRMYLIANKRLSVIYTFNYKKIDDRKLNKCDSYGK